MKKALLTLALAGTATLASAITFNWANATTLQSGVVGESWSTTITPEGSFAVRVTYVGTAVSSGNYGNKDLIQLSDGTNWYLMENDDRENPGTKYSGKSQTGGNSPGTEGGIPWGHEVNHTYAFLYDHEAKTLEYRVIDSGVETSLVTYNNITFGEEITVSGAGGLTGIFNGEANYSVQMVLPEPGVMALLALGVGAIALRRKGA